MKKNILASAIALLGGSMVYAQSGNFKIGAHAGFPTKVDESFLINAGVDVSYVMKVAENFNVGATTGYSHYFVKSSSGCAIHQSGFSGIIPIAASFEYLLTPRFYIGGDIGYAFITAKSPYGNGNFYYQPKVGYKFSKNELYLGYQGISASSGAVSSLNLGYNYTFGK